MQSDLGSTGLIVAALLVRYWARSKQYMTSNGMTSTVVERNYGHTPSTVKMPHLVALQIESFRRFEEEYLRDLFAEISPIQDFTGKNLELHFETYHKLAELHLVCFVSFLIFETETLLVFR